MAPSPAATIAIIQALFDDAAVVTDPLPTSCPPAARSWYVYLVRSANGALYCGISDNPQRRFAQHQSGKGARFFSSSPAVALVYVECWPDKSQALRHERLIKALRKSAKEALVASFVPISAVDEPVSA